MKILCRTLFDCTKTGTTGHFKIGQVPYTDAAGNSITDIQTWTRSRNQQRNFESILQMISLRAQPEIMQPPQCDNGVWRFEFDVETAGVYSTNGDASSVDGLLLECQGMPMIVGLNENNMTSSTLITQGADQNIWFETINI